MFHVSQRKAAVRVAAAGVCLLLTTAAFSQQGGAPKGGAPKGGAPTGGGGMSMSVPPMPETGFQQIFDGKTLNGWEGDTKFWRVENGTIIGQTAKDKQPAQNSFLIWRGGSPADFELKLQYKLTGYNSGVQIRSTELPDIKLAMKGYQADMDGAQMFTGQFYEERGRGFLAMRGQFSIVREGGKPGVVGSLGDSNELKSAIKGDDWNDLHLIARGNLLVQILNGRVTSMLLDDDKAGRKLDGLIGFQVHVGDPMKIELKNLRLKKM
jgi:hypothetical protein